MSKEANQWARSIRITTPGSTDMNPLKGSARSVIRELADLAKAPDHSCFPGQQWLAERVGVSIRTLRRALNVLEGHGLITVERRFDSRGHRSSDLLRMRLDVTVVTVTGEPDAAEQDKPVHPVVDNTTGTVDNPPTGQIDRRSVCPSLPANLSIPTGQFVRAYKEEPLSESLRGGREAPTPLSPTCAQHPNGTDQPCRNCGDARRLWQHHRDQNATTSTPPVLRAVPRYDFTIHCEHLLLRTDHCEACERETRIGGVA